MLSNYAYFYRFSSFKILVEMSVGFRRDRCLMKIYISNNFLFGDLYKCSEVMGENF